MSPGEQHFSYSYDPLSGDDYCTRLKGCEKKDGKGLHINSTR